MIRRLSLLVTVACVLIALPAIAWKGESSMGVRPISEVNEKAEVGDYVSVEGHLVHIDAEHGSMAIGTLEMSSTAFCHRGRLAIYASVAATMTKAVSMRRPLQASATAIGMLWFSRITLPSRARVTPDSSSRNTAPSVDRVWRGPLIML